MCHKTKCITNSKDTPPSSSRTSSVVLFLWTPRRCLQNMCKFSMGLTFGSGRHPQQSLPYNKIGFIRES